MKLKVKIKKRLKRFELDADFETDCPMALLGASGSGKSMTLKCIAGIEKPDSGIISLNGRTLFNSERGINLPPQKRRIGYLFQSCALFPKMTVKENVQVAMKNKNNVDSVLKEFYLTGLEDKLPSEISGGQMQRTALARMIASKPEAILLDEPFSAIDSYMRWQLEMTVADIIEHFGGISVMVTHDRNEAYRNCKNICIIDNGKTEKQINSSELLTAPGTVGAAKVSGCKNIFLLERTPDERRIFIPELNIYLITAQKVSERKKYIGLRAHYFRFRGDENEIAGRITRKIEDIFSTILMLTPMGAEGSLRIETEKRFAANMSLGDKISVFFSPKEILLLE